MPGYHRSRHSVTALHIHMVFVTKYRHKAFTDQILTRCEDIMRDICTELDATLSEFNGETDHVHLLIAYPPTLPVATLAMRLKGRTAYLLRREHRFHMNQQRMNGHLWSPSYFAVSAGGAPPGDHQAIHRKPRQAQHLKNESGLPRPKRRGFRQTPGDLRRPRRGLTPHRIQNCS